MSSYLRWIVGNLSYYRLLGRRKKKLRLEEKRKRKTSDPQTGSDGDSNSKPLLDLLCVVCDFSSQRVVDYFLLDFCRGNPERALKHFGKDQPLVYYKIYEF